MNSVCDGIGLQEMKKNRNECNSARGMEDWLC